MSAKRYQRGGLDEGLAEYLGIKGQLNTEIESEIRPTITLRDLSNSPYVKDAVPVGANIQQAAVPAEFSWITIGAGVGVVLQIKKLWLINTGAAAQPVQIRLLSGADVTTIGLGTSQRFSGLLADNDWMLDRPSVLGAGSDALTNFGRSIFSARVPALQSLEISFPDPGIQLFNDPALVRSWLGVVDLTANDAFQLSAFGVEWPLPG